MNQSTLNNTIRTPAELEGSWRASGFMIGVVKRVELHL